MYFSTLATLAIAAASSVSGLVIPRATAPAGWATDYLEPYDTYNARYLAVGCMGKQGTTFFDQCCHPLLATETLENNRPAQCNPASASSSPAAVKTTPTAAAVKTTSTAADSSTDDDDDDEDCEDDDGDDDVSSTPAVTPTPVVTSTHAVAPTTTPATTQAPTTTKAAVVASTPHTTAAPATTTKAQTTAKAATTQASSSSSEVQTGGFATFFYQNGVAGACGTVHQDTDLIAAIDADRYGNTGERSSLCGKQVKITNTQNGNTVTVTIADACPTCNNGNSIDLSESAFKQLASLDTGLVPISWSFL